MNERYYTDRLILSVLDEEFSDLTREFYYSGREAFARVEPKKEDVFYSPSYQRALLRNEYSAFLEESYARYFFFLRDNPDKIIGTVSLANIQRGPYNSCTIGYKLLPEFQKKGYALEGIARIITAAFNDWNIHRIEAFVLPDNVNSISLLKRLGFSLEGVAKSIIRLNDSYVDHNRYVIINPGD